MRVHTIKRRVTDLERLLVGKIDERRTDFDRRVLLQLLGNLEYRRIVQDLFERICESEAPMVGAYIHDAMTRSERERIRTLTEEAERSVVAGPGTAQ